MGYDPSTGLYEPDWDEFLEDPDPAGDLGYTEQMLQGAAAAPDPTGYQLQAAEMPGVVAPPPGAQPQLADAPQAPPSDEELLALSQQALLDPGAQELPEEPLEPGLDPDTGLTDPAYELGAEAGEIAERRELMRQDPITAMRTQALVEEERQAQEQQEAYREAQQAREELRARVESEIQEIGVMKPWHDRVGTPTVIASIIGGMIGGFLAPGRGGRNMFLEQLNRTIDRDMELQRQQINQKLKALQTESGMEMSDIDFQLRGDLAEAKLRSAAWYEVAENYEEHMGKLRDVKAIQNAYKLQQEANANAKKEQREAEMHEAELDYKRAQAAKLKGETKGRGGDGTGTGKGPAINWKKYPGKPTNRSSSPEEQKAAASNPGLIYDALVGGYVPLEDVYGRTDRAGSIIRARYAVDGPGGSPVVKQGFVSMGGASPTAISETNEKLIAADELTQTFAELKAFHEEHGKDAVRTSWWSTDEGEEASITYMSAINKMRTILGTGALQNAEIPFIRESTGVDPSDIFKTLRSGPKSFETMERKLKQSMQKELESHGMPGRWVPPKANVDFIKNRGDTEATATGDELQAAGKSEDTVEKRYYVQDVMDRLDFFRGGRKGQEAMKGFGGAAAEGISTKTIDLDETEDQLEYLADDPDPIVSRDAAAALKRLKAIRAGRVTSPFTGKERGVESKAERLQKNYDFTYDYWKKQQPGMPEEFYEDKARNDTMIHPDYR